MNNATTASQPKSIGDEALFHDAMMHFLTHATTAKLLRKQPEYLAIAAMFDSCVSAPIKAAPTISTITLTGHQLVAALDLLAPGLPRDPEELDCDLTFGVVQHKDDDGNVATGMCCWNDDTDGVLPLDEHPGDAAAIQEPVMVAEPVGEYLPGGFNGDVFWNGAPPPRGTKLYASPMAADPAGVESMRAAFEVWVLDKVQKQRPGEPLTEDNRRFLLRRHVWDKESYADYDGEWMGWQAATVKAVPSEAQSRRVGVPENMIQWAVRELLGALPERRDWLNPDAEAVLRAEFQRAAPLTDKTGGGK